MAGGEASSGCDPGDPGVSPFDFLPLFLPCVFAAVVLLSYLCLFLIMSVFIDKGRRS